MNLHIETNRLLIRNFQENDWKDIASRASRRHVEVRNYMLCCIQDEGRSFEIANQVEVSNHLMVL